MLENSRKISTSASLTTLKPLTMSISSVAQSCLTLCVPMDCSTPGYSVHHQLPELTQISVPLSPWFYPTISSSVIHFSSCLQSFPASGSFPMSQFFTSGGQSIGASASGLPMNMRDWSPLGWTCWISLQSKGFSRVFSSTTVQRPQFYGTQPFFFYCELSHPYMTIGKTIDLTIWTFVGKVMSLLFTMLSRLAIASLPRSDYLLISWLQSPSAVILESPKIKSLIVSIVSLFICIKWWD